MTRAVLVVILLMTLFSSLAAASSSETPPVTVGPAHSIGESALRASGFAQASPASASSDSAYLVAWKHGNFDSPTIRAARISLEGELLDPVGFEIRGRGEWRESFQVIGSGDRHAIISEEATLRRVTFVERDGSLVPGPLLEKSGSILWDGLHFLIIGLADVKRYDREFRLVDHVTLPVPNGSTFGGAASRSGRTFIAFRVNTGGSPITTLHVVVLGSNGEILRASDVITLSSPVSLSLEASEDRLFIVWQLAGSVGPHLEAIILDDQLQTRARFPTRGAAGVVWSGEAFLQPHSTYSPTDGFRVEVDVYGRNGSLRGTRSVAPIDAREFSLASSGGNVMAIWSDRYAGTFTLLDQSGERIADLRNLTSSLPIQTSATAASDGAGFLVVWNERLDRKTELVAQKLDLTGEPVSPVTVITTADRSELYPSQLYPAVDFDGTSFVVAWQQFDPTEGRASILAARLSVDGALLDPEPISVERDSDASTPSIASHAGITLISWTVPTTPYGDSEVVGRHLDNSGAFLEPARFQISFLERADGTISSSSVPLATHNGRDFVVIWWRTLNERCVRGCPPPLRTELAAARISLNTVPIDYPSRIIQEFADRPTPAFSAASAAGATVIVSAHPVAGNAQPQIVVIGLDGELNFAGTDGTVSAGSPRVEFDGTSFLLIAASSSRGGDYAEPAPISSSRVSSQGHLLDKLPDGSLSQLPLEGVNPTLARSHGDSSLMLYEVTVDSVANGPSRRLAAVSIVEEKKSRRRPSRR